MNIRSEFRLTLRSDNSKHLPSEPGRSFNWLFEQSNLDKRHEMELLKHKKLLYMPLLFFFLPQEFSPYVYLQTIVTEVTHF